MPTAKNKRVTLKDIAEKLNVSTATVSRAMRDHPDISQRIKDQVNLLVETLHYRPNSFALHLRKQHSGIIGVLLPKIVHHFSSTVISGIMEAAHEHKCQILICESGSNQEEEKENLWALVNAGVDGLLISVSNHTHDESHFAQAMEEGIPIVFFDKVPATIPAIKVCTNDYKGAFEATHHLIQQGCVRIAHLQGQPGSRNALPRLNGYRDALHQAGMLTDESLIKVCTECNEEEGYKYAGELMQLPVPPDGIFCINDETAIGVLAALRQQNVAIPNKVAVVGFCNSKTADYCQPSLSSVEQEGKKLGTTALHVLLQAINGDKPQEQDALASIVLEPALCLRASSLRKKD